MPNHKSYFKGFASVVFLIVMVVGLVGATTVQVINNSKQQVELEELRGGELEEGSISYDKLAEDVFTSVEIELPDGTTTTAKMVSGNIAEGMPSGNLQLETADGEIIEGTVTEYAPTEIEVEDGSITEVKLARVFVERIEKLEDGDSGTEGESGIADGSVITVKIADGAVTTSKLANGSVTTVKILDASITSGKLQDAVVLTQHLGSSSVTSVKIKDGAITSSKLFDGVVTSLKIADGTIADVDISNTADIAYSKLNLTGSLLLGDIGQNSCIDGQVMQWNTLGGTWICASAGTQLSEAQTESYIFDGDNVGILASGTLALGSLSFTGTLSDTHIVATVMVAGENISLLNNDAGYVTGVDFSDGGEAGGANRTLGNTDSYALGFLTNNAVRLSLANTGAITFNGAYSFPTVDGTNGQVLQTDGSGALSWATGSGSTVWTKTGTDLSPTTAGDDLQLNAGETLSLADMTTGSIPFIGASGLLSQDNAALFWSSGSDRLGIGTATLTAAAEISSQTGGHALRVTANTEDSELEFYGFTYDAVLSVTNANSQAMIKFGTEETANNGWAMVGRNSGENYRMDIASGVDVSHGNDDGTTRVTILQSGDVGIGTVAPDYTLDVVGTVGIDEYLYHNGDTNTYTQFSPDRWQVFAGGRSMIDAQYSSDLAINEGGVQMDFRVEGGNEANLLFTDGSTDRVGIGTAAPDFRLELEGTASTADRKIGINDTQVVYLPDQASFISSLVIGNGGTNLSHTAGDEGYYNTFVGMGVGSTNTTGHSNSAIGTNALTRNTTGNFNSAMGRDALYYNTTGDYNSAMGNSALLYNTTGSYNTAIGRAALYENRANSRSTAIGYGAMLNADNRTTGQDTYNTAVGYEALRGSTTAGNNVGRFNVAIGDSALHSNTAGYYNSAMGAEALRQNTTGNYNTAVGMQALDANTTGDYNTAVGMEALDANITGSNNTAFGYNADVSSGNLTNAMALGYMASVNVSNKVRIGDSSVTVIEGQVAWSYPSDSRLKENIKESVLGLEFINKLNPVTFNYKEGNTGIEYTGLIAQEVEAALEGVEFSGLNRPQSGDDFYSLSYSTFIVPLINAVQELDEKVNGFTDQTLSIEELGDSVASLQIQIDELGDLSENEEFVALVERVSGIENRLDEKDSEMNAMEQALCELGRVEFCEE